MANRWAEEPETGEQPKADLNPLLNPVLEENLGRWAQVYFTNPPEKRERAVMDLLRELETRSVGEPEEVPVPHENNRAAAPATERILCPICKADNRSDQRFCGLCGAILRAPQPAAQAPLAPNTMSFLGLSSSTPSENDLAFLREKSFEKSYYETESSPRRARYIVAALLILVGGIGYLSWPAWRTHLPPSWQMSPQARAVPAAQSQAPIAESAETTPPQASAPDTTLPPAQSPAGSRDLGNQREPGMVTPTEPQPKSAAPRPDSSPRTVTLASDAHASRTITDGTQELLLAQRYLHEGSTAMNRAEAARWLWKSVGKQNPHAALLLADMYTRGDGVSKSCDQARILLGAAARKGLPDAGVKLRSLQSSGCR